MKSVLKAEAVNAALLGLAVGLDNDIGDGIALAGSTIVKGMFSSHRQDRESEADLLALYYLDRAGLSTQPMVRLLTTLELRQRRFAGVWMENPIYRSHPPTAHRIRRARTIRSASPFKEGAAVGFDSAGYVRGGFEPLWVADHNGALDVVGVLTSPNYLFI